MKALITYIKDIIGLEIEIRSPGKTITDKLPMYLNEGYQWHKTMLADKPCILAQMKEANTFSIAQMEKHFNKARGTIGLPIIAVFNKLEAYNRKRLIEKKLAFIVPDKQLYIPDFFIDLREYGITAKKEQSKLTPTAQQLFLFFILDKKNKLLLENKTFKELAVLLDTKPMGITRAVDNLKQLGIIEVRGRKEKFIHFRLEKKELWNNLEQRNLLINPVLKRVYVDEKPPQVSMLYSNASALTEYSNMNPSSMDYYAIEKNAFYTLQKAKTLVNANEHEGRFCLEVWKYNPDTLVLNDAPVVDPLSLYLSLKDSPDERTEIALEQIIKKFIW